MNDDLHHFTSRLGIEQAESLLLPSPFDYSRQGVTLCAAQPAANQSTGLRTATGGNVATDHRS